MELPLGTVIHADRHYQQSGRSLSTDDETVELMPSPVCRIILDPEFCDLAVNHVGDLTKRTGTTHRSHAVGFIHCLHIHSTIALPGNYRQHIRPPTKIVRPHFP